VYLSTAHIILQMPSLEQPSLLYLMIVLSCDGLYNNARVSDCKGLTRGFFVFYVEIYENILYNNFNYFFSQGGETCGEVYR